MACSLGDPGWHQAAFLRGFGDSGAWGSATAWSVAATLQSTGAMTSERGGSGGASRHCRRVRPAAVAPK
eukprot:scaffold226847_cov36-Tisochrysis_lutea.AAC.2